MGTSKNAVAITIEDVCELHFISQLRFSPAGTFAGFVVTKGDKEANSYHSNIWLYDVQSGEQRQLEGTLGSNNLTWINDDEFLFSTTEGIQTVYHSLSVSTGVVSEYMRIPTIVNQLEMITEDLFVVTALFQNSTPALTEDESDYMVFDELPFWANGIGVTNKRRFPVFLYDRTSGAFSLISDTFTNGVALHVSNNKVYYAAERYTDIRSSKQGIYSYDLTSKQTEVLLVEKDYLVQYIYTVGEQVYFTGTDEKTYGVSENPEVYRLTADGPELFVKLEYGYGSGVTTDAKLYGNSTISYHQGYLYLIVTMETRCVLQKIDNCGAISILYDNDEAISGFAVNGEQILLVTMDAVSLQEVYRLEDGMKQQLTHFNDEFSATRFISIPEYTEFVYEGVTIQGYVMKPINFDENQQYPGVLSIHGGPKVAFGSVFFHEMQVLASEGYFVFYCNPHGSDGRGNEFADVRGKYGTIDYEELMAFTDHVLAQYPQLDASRLAATGGSYGGFMVNWIIGHTERFKCCSAQRSISSWISNFLTTDIGYYFDGYQQAATPWVDGGEKMWWHSPLKYADKAKTPTLFIHSDEDYRCWMVQGIQMFAALKYHGVDSRICIIPDENHELSRSGKPLHRIRRLKEITTWFENYLN